MNALLRAAALLALAYAVILALVWWGQERLLFHPQRLAPDHRFDVGADVTQTWIDVPGGRLHALHLQQAQAAGVVFFLHGNAGSLDNWFVDLDFYRRNHFDLFMPDYRGFGKSSGRIESQAQLEADVRAAWNHVAARYAGRRMVIFGRSLGTALAAGLAADVQTDLLVLVSPYSSMQALARHHYPWVPEALLRYPLRTEDALARVRAPVLLVHGGQDTLIPASHSETLQAVAPQAHRVLVPRAGHNDLQAFQTYREALSAALQATAAAQVQRLR